MDSTRLIIFTSVVVAALVAFIMVYVPNWLGKPVRGTLRVPQGKNRVKVSMFDDAPLRPFKYGQVFEASFSPVEQELTSIYSGETQTGVGTLYFRGKPFGFADQDDQYTEVLAKLAEISDKIIVQTVVTSLDNDNRPVVELCLPNPTWFAHAFKAYSMDRRNRKS